MAPPGFLEQIATINVAAGDEIGGAPPGSARTNFTIEPQEQTNWCWAAVGVSVARFYDPAHSQSQCELASVALDRNDCCSDGAADLTKCNQPWYLDRVLNINGNLESKRTESMSFTDVQAEVGADSPVGCRIGWFGGGGHFAVITGWLVAADGTEYIDIADPIYLDSQIAYDAFASSYQAGGDWTHTYLTQPTGAGGAVALSDTPDPDSIGA